MADSHATNNARALLAPKGSKCDTWGTCHGTSPIILPYREDTLNAARWLRDLELRWPAHGDARAKRSGQHRQLRADASMRGMGRFVWRSGK